MAGGVRGEYKVGQTAMNPVGYLILRSLLAVAANVPTVGATVEPNSPPPGWVAVPPPSTEDEWFCANYSADEWRVALEGETLQIFPAKDSARVTLELPGGRLEGINHGEFGGTIQWHDDRTKKVITIVKDNPVAFYPADAGVFAFVGIAHLSIDEGGVLKLQRTPTGRWSAAKVMDLGTAPNAIFPDDRDTTLVLTTRGVMKVNVHTLQKTRLFQNEHWYLLYGQSIVAFRGNVFVGGRRGVIRLQPTASGYSEEWWVRSSCRRVEGPECKCVP